MTDPPSAPPEAKQRFAEIVGRIPPGPRPRQALRPPHVDPGKPRRPPPPRPWGSPRLRLVWWSLAALALAVGVVVFRGQPQTWAQWLRGAAAAAAIAFTIWRIAIAVFELRVMDPHDIAVQVGVKRRPEAAPTGVLDPATESAGGPPRAYWLPAGLVVLAVASVWALVVVNARGAVFGVDGAFALLAVLAGASLALERLSEAVLAPWWGKMPSRRLARAMAPGAGDRELLPSGVQRVLTRRRRLGVTDVTGMRAALRPVTRKRRTDDRNAATTARARATLESAWLQVRADRATLPLPAAAIATVICAYLHLYLLHGLGAAVGSGLPTTRLAFAVDALLTGLAMAAVAKAFHDLVGGRAGSTTRR
jgi:hypothetical protein